MALQLRRGTNKERLQITPVEGELIFVTDWELVQITGTSIDGTTDTITFSAAHGLSIGDQILFQSATQLGLTNGTSYFVISSGLTTTACKVSTSSGGAAVDLTTGSALTLTFARTPTTAAGVPVGTNVAALWIGDGTTVGGIPGNTQGLDDLSDVIITTPAQGDLLFYNGTDWVNENVIQTGSANNRPEFQYNNSSAGLSSAIVLRKNYGSSTFTDGDGIGIRFEVDSDSQATTEYATLTIGYDAAAPEFSINTSINDGSTYQVALSSSTVITDVRGDLRVRGNDIKNSGDFTIITMGAGSGDQVTFAGDIQVGGNDIKASDGSTNITLTSGTMTTFAGDIKIAGNDIQSSSSIVALTLSGSDVTVAGDLTVTGNDIKSSGGTTAITMSGANVTIAGDLTVNGTTTTVNSTTLTVDDKNIELGSVATPTDSTADGGGITLKGASDKTIIWENTYDWWRSNQALATDTSLTVNAIQSGADASIYFGTPSSLTAKTLRWDHSDQIFYLTDSIRVEGNIGAEGNLAVNRDASDDNAQIIFYKPTSGTETLQWDKTANRFEFSDSVYASGTLTLDGDSASINADGTATDSYLYLKSNTHYLKWDNGGARFDFSHTLRSNGDLEANGNLQLNQDQTDAVDVSVYFGTAASKTAKQLRWDYSDQLFYLTDSLRAEGNIAAEGNLAINRDASDDNAQLIFYKPTSGTETLIWDKTDTRFEFSSKLFVNGDGIINGDLYTEAGGDVYIDGDSIVLNNGNTAATSTIKFYTDGATDPTFKWNNSTSLFEFNKDVYSSGSIIGNTHIGTNGNDIYFNNDDGGTGATSTITVKRGANADVAFRWNETSDRWESTTNGSTYIELPDQGLDQADSPTFAGVTAGNVRVGVTGDNEIDTSSGNLTIDSAGGTTTLDDDIVVAGDITHNGTTATFNNNVILGATSADTLTVNAVATFNQDIACPSVTVDTRAALDTSTVSTSSITTVTVNETARNTMSGQVYITDGTDVHSVLFSATRNGATALLTTFAEMYSTSALATFTADISGGNLRLRATTTTASALTFTASRISLT